MKDLTKSEARIELLKLRESEWATGDTFPIRVGDEDLRLKVFRVANDVPKFRIENGRIMSRVMKLQSDPETAKILSQPTSDAAQKLLETELLALAQEANLMKTIQKMGYQAEPLLLTYDGIVVNGNRRLSILKKLDIGNGYVDVCRLPQSTTREEIQLIELTLQMDNPGKAQYSWINQLLTVSHNLHMGLTREQIRNAMPGQSDADIKKLIDTIDVVDKFLERQGTPGDYSSIGEDKYFFDELQKGLTKHRNSPESKEALMWGAASYYVSPPDDPTEDRNFKKITKLSKYVDQVVNAFGEDSAPSPAEVDPDDPLGQVRPVNSPFEHKKIDRGTSSKIHSVVIDAEEREKRRKDNLSLFNDLETFARRMASAAPDSRTAKPSGILEQISNIETEFKRIKRWALDQKGS